jgi:hypothetical protein
MVPQMYLRCYLRSKHFTREQYHGVLFLVYNATEKRLHNTTCPSINMLSFINKVIRNPVHPRPY